MTAAAVADETSVAAAPQGPYGFLAVTPEAVAAKVMEVAGR